MSALAQEADGEPVTAAEEPVAGALVQVASADASLADAQGPAGQQRPAPEEHPVLGTSWYARASRGDPHCVTREEVDEFFHAVDRNHSGTLEVHEIREAVRCCPRAVQQIIEEALQEATDFSNEGRLDVDQFLQAMRLGSAQQPTQLAWRHRDDEKSSGRIRRDRLVQYLRRRKEMYDNCLSLPFTFAYFVVFFLVVLGHFKQRTVFRLTEAVERELPLATLESDYPGALLGWLDGRAESSRLARYNLLVGGIYAERMADDERRHLLEGALQLQTLCAYSMFDYVLQPRRSAPAVCRTAADRAEQAATNDTHWLLWPLLQDEYAAEAAAVRGWWDVSTTGSPAGLSVALSGPERVEVSMLARNEHLHYFVFYRLVFQVGDSGATRVTKIAAALDAEPLWQHWERDRQRGVDQWCFMLLDGLFCLMYVALGLGAIWDFASKMLRHGIKRGLREWATVWALIDWLNIVMAAFCTVLYFYGVELSRGLSQLVGQLPAASEAQRYSGSELAVLAADSGQASWSEYLLSLDAALEQAALLTRAQADVRWYAAVLAACVCLRFFKAFRANPRLNVVTLTLQKASVDFLHFFFIFLFVFLGFAVVGHTIFGGHVDAFSSIGRAIHSTFLMMMGYIFDTYKEQMFEHGGALAVVWVAVFCCLVVLLLLDMVLAIILDVYTEVNAQMGSTPSLLRQAHEVLLERWERAGMLQLKAWGDDPRSGTASMGSLDVQGGSTSDLQKSLRKARRRFTDSNILEALEKEGLKLPGEEGVLDAESLGTALHADSQAERLHLEVILQRALQQESMEREAISLSDSVVLCSRADANLRDLGPLAREIIERARGWESERADLYGALAEARQAAVRSPSRQKGGGSRPMTQESNYRSQERGSPVLMAEPTKPEPAGASPPGPALHALVEERIAKAGEQQAERHSRLEASIQRLAQRLEPVLESGVTDVSTDMRRLRQLEEKIQTLTAALEPVLAIEPGQQPRQKQKERLRRPSPPRALMEPAPARIERGRTQGHNDSMDGKLNM